MPWKRLSTIRNALVLSALGLGAPGCMGELTLPLFGCAGAAPGQACDQPSATAKTEVYVSVTNERNGNLLVDARVEIIEGADAGTWCVTRVGGGWWSGEAPGCLLGELAQWNRKVRVTKEGFTPREEATTGPVPGGVGVTWAFELARQ